MPHGISYVWTLKYNITETVYGTEKDLQRQKTEQTPGCQGGGWERNAVGFGVSRCKLLYIECINNKDLLYDTGKCIQYPYKS